VVSFAKHCSVHRSTYRMGLDAAPDAGIVLDTAIEALLVSVVSEAGEHAQHARKAQDFDAAQGRKDGLCVRVCNSRGQVHLQRSRWSLSARLASYANINQHCGLQHSL